MPSLEYYGSKWSRESQHLVSKPLFWFVILILEVLLALRIWQSDCQYLYQAIYSVFELSPSQMYMTDLCHSVYLLKFPSTTFKNGKINMVI